MIEPVQSRLLVELLSKYKNFNPTDERFQNSKTRGTVLAIAPDIAETCKKLKIKVGDIVYFGAYEDMARYGNDDQILIKLEDVGGRGEAD
jgi:co-chaperonin GroES (HSP10)